MSLRSVNRQGWVAALARRRFLFTRRPVLRIAQVLDLPHDWAIVDPKEVNTPEGEMRFLMLREMFRAVALQGAWIHTVSNWALGTTGAYMGFLVANLDKIQPHLHRGWQWPVFGCALASTVWGIVIQILWGFIQFSTGVENQILSFTLPRTKNPQQFGIVLPPGDTADRFFKRMADRALKEFIESRPWAFRELAEWGSKKGESDIVYVPKTAASCAQMTFAFLIAQYILLGVAIFWPFARIR
jgi:hypothetical protein